MTPAQTFDIGSLFVALAGIAAAVAVVVVVTIAVARLAVWFLTTVARAIAWLWRRHIFAVIAALLALLWTVAELPKRGALTMDAAFIGSIIGIGIILLLYVFTRPRQT
jgi:hypothetical protein